MAIYCMQCGKELPDDANFCLKCGKPLNGSVAPSQSKPTRWEYKDLVIRLNNVRIDSDRQKEWQRAIDGINSLILDYLRYEGQSGWQAEGSTDFTTLSQKGAVEQEGGSGLFGTYWHVYKSIRIRLKRLAS